MCSVQISNVCILIRGFYRSLSFSMYCLLVVISALSLPYVVTDSDLP